MSEVDIGTMINDRTPERTGVPLPTPTQDNLKDENKTEPEFDPAGEANGIPDAPPPMEELFDPAIHCSGPNGQGVKTKKGKFRRKRQAASQKVKVENSDFAGAVANVSTLGIVQMIVVNSTLVLSKYWGDEWKLQIDEERILTETYAKYIAYKGWDSALSPEAVVIGVTISVFLPRLLGPGFQNWFSRSILGRKNAHTDNRANPQWQDNPSENNRPTNGSGGETGTSFRPIPGNALGGSHPYRPIN